MARGATETGTAARPGAPAPALRDFVPRETARDREYQERKLRACGVDPAVFGGLAETGLYGQDCFKQMTASGETLDGMVHLGQRFALHRAAALGERLAQTGRIASDEPGPRGRRILQAFEFRRADGTLAVAAEMHRLTPDPALMGARRGGSRPAAADPREGFARLAEKEMRPEDVAAFSEDVGNLIHFDPDFAARYGYRAPIAQGIQTMVWAMGALARDRAPARFDVFARFPRPVHWDEAVSLWAAPAEPRAGGRLRVLDSGGKVAAELDIAALAY